MLSLWRNKLSIELQDGQLLVRPSKHPHRVHGAICEGLLRLKLYRPQTLSDLSISITAKANIMTETGTNLAISLFRKDFTVLDDDVELDPGEHSFPFVAWVPPSAPSSSEQADSSIRYELVATSLQAKLQAITLLPVLSIPPIDDLETVSVCGHEPELGPYFISLDTSAPQLGGYVTVSVHLASSAS